MARTVFITEQSFAPLIDQSGPSAGARYVPLLARDLRMAYEHPYRHIATQVLD